MTALRFGRVLLAAALIPFCGSCERQPTGGDPPARAPQITGATLVAGGEGFVTGINLDLLSSSITVDGHGVVATLRTATEIRFAMPAKRPCEVDGKAVQTAAGAASYSGLLTVPSVLRMEPGESRIHDVLSEVGSELLVFPSRELRSPTSVDTEPISERRPRLAALRPRPACGFLKLCIIHGAHIRPDDLVQHPHGRGSDGKRI